MTEINNNHQPLNSEFVPQSSVEQENITSSDSNSPQKTTENQSNGLSDKGITLEHSSGSNTEPKDDGQGTQNHQNIDWHKLAHKLREHNRKLLKKVFQLEQEVAETNNRISEHKVRSQSTDMLIAQQAEEINHNQEEIAHILQQLETSQQEAHSQQVLIDSLSKQLETANEQCAQLERECTLVQEKYNKQTHELFIKTQQVQELSARLNRQQRYTLQYKAALDQYLEVGSSNLVYETKSDGEVLPTHPQPIQAWSQIQARKETFTIKASNLGIYKETSTFESELKLNHKPSKEANWPSPIINSVDNEKKPKSLAAVELPTFHEVREDLSISRRGISNQSNSVNS